MKNFVFQAPTKIAFGEGQISHLPKLLAEHGQKVLLVYGGGSVKRNGIYEAAIGLLAENKFIVTELAGVEPNPRIETVLKGRELCLENEIDVILAIGGGSTIDCSKAIAAARYYDGNPWDFTQDRSLVGEALPLVTILTMSATGSEMNGGAVITNLATQEKLGMGGPTLIPKASILDPTYTYSVPTIQTAAGSADIMSHLIENYFSRNTTAALQDRIAEGIMKTVIAYTPVALAEPTNYEARANLMWSSSLALNGLTGSGKEGTWTCHAIEHELSAFYDITHGIGLAIVIPRWMEHVLNEQTVSQFVAFAVNVFGIEATGDDFAVARAGIKALYETFASWGIPMTLPEVGIDESKLALMAEKAIEHSAITKHGFVSLEAKDVEEILKNCF
ncbi:iron-containing alcohol dehydrogenase [Vagococcus salmoninarum]|uniref:iron-containing alcohol dehydrogenase n=1 Tax=Vagococcus salmoninarum TaxID=2739 RepID=UPI0018829815|nr:iron-containing alcohol dehydrogenase [Vagococcus salmoninarum]MBE9389068.1 iron-containing alcohol dehydrogenase [Vagococcus salmoninarum]